MNFDAHIDRILSRHAELQALMAQPDTPADKYASYAREYADMADIVETATAYKNAHKEKADLEAMLADPDMKDLAASELDSLRNRLPGIEQRMKLAILPRDAADNGSAILEIRAGTGGDEAALFAGDLLRMYRQYAAIRGWRFEVMDMAESDLGGMKEVIVSVEGQGVYARLKYESGVHRVQRVPTTEAGGRIHTSAATVAVLPEAEDVELNIRDEDLRIDVYRAGGAGGQHVNKTESAVRITHIPTGVVVAIQDEKSQHKNKAKALKILSSRILDAQREAAHQSRAADRKAQVGSGDRSERIRTYNFPQGRVTDHRVNLTLHAIDRVMAGQDLDEIVDALATEDQLRKMTEIGIA